MCFCTHEFLAKKHPKAHTRGQTWNNDTTPIIHVISVEIILILLIEVCEAFWNRKDLPFSLETNVQTWTQSTLLALLPHRLFAARFASPSEVQLAIQTVAAVVLDIPAERSFLLCGVAANSSMSVTHRLIPGGAISAQPLTGMHVHTVSHCLNPTLSLSLSLSFSCHTSYLSPPLCLCFTFPGFLFSCSQAIKGSEEYYHLGTILTLWLG